MHSETEVDCMISNSSFQCDELQLSDYSLFIDTVLLTSSSVTHLVFEDYSGNDLCVSVHVVHFEFVILCRLILCRLPRMTIKLFFGYCLI